MATIPASENEFPKVLLTEGAAAATPGTGLIVAYAKTGGVFAWKDDGGTEHIVGEGDVTAHTGDTTDAHDASAISVLDSGANFTGTDVEAVLAELQDNIDAVGGGATYTGQPIVIAPINPMMQGTGGTNNSTSFAWATVINVHAPMKLRAMSILVSSSGSGSIQWGLFDGSSTPTTAVKIAGGSAAPGGTGWRNIAAGSAPVTVNPGGYVLIWQMPSSNASTITTLVFPSAPYWNQINSSGYVWDDTPDLTSANWVSNTTAACVVLVGDLDGSGTLWA